MSNLSKCCAVALSISVMSFASSSVMAAACGPGDHWVDDCPAGTDEAPSTAEVVITYNSDGSPVGPDCSGNVTTELKLVGPTRIEREHGVPHSIDTEMMSMVLTGGGMILRAGISAGASMPTLGQIIEQPSNPKLADSFFEVFFEIDTPLGTLHNNDPVRMEAVIDRVPPLGIFYRPPMPMVLLYDTSDDFVMACLRELYHLSVTLDSVTATVENGEVYLEWETGIEKDNTGFVVWRGQPIDGKCSNDPSDYTNVLAITLWVASQGTEVSGATYTMTDNNVVSGNTYCYVLEDVDYSGNSTFHMNDKDIVSATP